MSFGLQIQPRLLVLVSFEKYGETAIRQFADQVAAFEFIQATAADRDVRELRVYVAQEVLISDLQQLPNPLN